MLLMLWLYGDLLRQPWTSLLHVPGGLSVLRLDAYGPPAWLVYHSGVILNTPPLPAPHTSSKMAM